MQSPNGHFYQLQPQLAHRHLAYLICTDLHVCLSYKMQKIVVLKLELAVEPLIKTRIIEPHFSEFSSSLECGPKTTNYEIDTYVADMGSIF